MLISCSSDDNKDSTEEINPNGIDEICTDKAKFIFNETNSVVLVEFENAIFESGWDLVEDLSNSTGEGYMLWEGGNSYSNPGNGVAVYKLKINNPGTYRFIWRSSVKEGDDQAESNDTWLRFNDASDFYGKKSNGSIVYPKGIGKEPNPNGASSNGWFKIYRGGKDLDFKWQSLTSDKDSHNVYVVFDSPDIYTMEISGRSKGHAIDKFILFDTSLYSENEATSLNSFTEILCR